MPPRALLFLTMCLLCCTPFLHAQKRVEAGAFLDYLAISQTDTPNLGLGARFGYRMHRNIMLEGELAYDYGVNFRELYIDASNTDGIAIERTSIGVTDGLIGPKFEPAAGHFHPFATVKGGFVDFRLSPSLLPYSTEISTILGLRTSSVNAALYPGGGAEVTLGPLGLRCEAGDLIYFNRGAHNNLRLTFGPVLRF